MELKPFDLEAAKRGEPIEYRSTSSGRWIPMYFVGIANDGWPVIHAIEAGRVFEPFRCHQSLLRMAPKKNVWYCRFYIEDGEPCLAKTGNPKGLNHEGANPWHGDVFAIEVEE